MDEIRLVRALKALADRKRLQMAREIACAGELSCTEVKAHFHLSQPTISHHLKILADAGVITVRADAGRLDAFHDLLPTLARALDVREVFRHLSAVVDRIVPHEEANLALV